MTRRRQKIAGGPPFTQIYHWLRKTDAWRSLGPYARLLYIELRAKYSGTNNGQACWSTAAPGSMAWIARA